MYNITPEQIEINYNEFINLIKTEFSEERSNKLLEMYSKYEERLILSPASIKTNYHNCIPGGYLDHVLRVYMIAHDIADIWLRYNPDDNSFTREELSFTALNHDLGKLGDTENELYIPSKDEWRKKNLGEMYTINPSVDYMTIPDRSIYLLSHHQVPFSMKEMIAIRIHDGLYDESNKSYLITYNVDSKLKSTLGYILHQADMTASRIEFDKMRLSQGSNVEKVKTTRTNSKMSKINTSDLKNPTKNPNIPPVKKSQTSGKTSNLFNDFFSKKK